jgi:hypothetical protein
LKLKVEYDWEERRGKNLINSRFAQCADSELIFNEHNKLKQIKI